MSLNRLLPIKAGHNFRELGGYQTTDGRQVQWHRLIRAGALGQLSEADLALLAQLNVTADIDFRSPTELEAAPTRPLITTNRSLTPTGPSHPRPTPNWSPS